MTNRDWFWFFTGLAVAMGIFLVLLLLARQYSPSPIQAPISTDSRLA